MRLSKFFVIALLTGSLAVIGCGSDGGGGGGDVDANELCNVEACIESDELENNCIRELTNCLDAGGNTEKCIAFAVETCTV